MSTRHIVEVIDDLSGKAIDEGTEKLSVSVTWPNGKTRVFDVTEESLLDVSTTLADIEAGSAPEQGDQPKKARRGAGRSSALNRRIRAWAQSEGHKVSSRGQIASTTVNAYFEAHPEDKSK